MDALKAFAAKAAGVGVEKVLSARLDEDGMVVAVIDFGIEGGKKSRFRYADGDELRGTFEQSVAAEEGTGETASASETPKAPKTPRGTKHRKG